MPRPLNTPIPITMWKKPKNAICNSNDWIDSKNTKHQLKTFLFKKINGIWQSHSNDGSPEHYYFRIIYPTEHMDPPSIQ